MNIRILIVCALFLMLDSLSARAQEDRPSAASASTVTVCAANSTDTHGCSLVTPGEADQVPINAAISHCSAANGCRIVLRNGIYNITGAIVIDRSYVTLEGETWPFWGGYVRPWSGASNPVSRVGTQGALIRAAATGFNLVEIQHHNLPDNGEPRHRGIRIANLYLVGKDYSNNCVDSMSSGNQQDDSGSFENLTVTRCAYGFYISVDNGYISQNNMQDLSVAGAFVSGANSRFINNLVWDVGGRGLLTAVRGMVVTGNTFGDTQSYSIDAQGPGVALITGNGFGPAAPAAASINLACSGCVVSGNYFDTTTGAFRNQHRTAPTVRVANSAATNNVITGNSFVTGGTEASGAYAIDVSISTGNIVLGNGIGSGFNNGSATTIHTGTGNLVTLNRGDATTSGQSTQQITFQPGPLGALFDTKGGFSRFAKRALVENIDVSAIAFSCSVNPVVTLYECGSSSKCENPVEIGSATVTAAGVAAQGRILNPGVGPGDYIAWGFSAGKCSSLNIAATAQAHDE